jgi:hypothetical protein
MDSPPHACSRPVPRLPRGGSEAPPVGRLSGFGQATKRKCLPGLKIAVSFSRNSLNHGNAASVNRSGRSAYATFEVMPKPIRSFYADLTLQIYCTQFLSTV